MLLDSLLGGCQAFGLGLRDMAIENSVAFGDPRRRGGLGGTGSTSDGSFLDTGSITGTAGSDC